MLRKQPPDRYVINFRASYAEETGVMVRGLVKRGIKPEQIAFFTQKDGYGDSGFAGAMQAFAGLRGPIDAFFEKVTVNVADNPDLRLNRLRLLNQIRATMDSVADFSRIEG